MGPETPWYRSLTYSLATPARIVTLIVSFMFLLIMVSDHYRGSAPPGALSHSLLWLFVALAIAHALSLAGTRTLQDVIAGTAFDFIIVVGGVLTLFGGLDLFATWLAGGTSEDIFTSFCYFLPGASALLFWIVARRV